MEKPTALFDRDQEWKALTSFVSNSASSLSLGVVSGRRRQGKTYLLQALTHVTGGFYFAAEESTEPESLTQLGRALADYLQTPGQFVFESWADAMNELIKHCAGRTIVIDEFPYLLKSSPALPSVIQHVIDQSSHPWDTDHQDSNSSSTQLILCGSAMSVMGTLLSGTAPLRGRASLELIVKPFDYRTAAEFWQVKPRLAALLHSTVGGTPAYRTRYVNFQRPETVDEFDQWIVDHVLDNSAPLYREARYLIASEAGIRDTSIYHAVLGAITAGRHTRSGIADHCGKQASDLTHSLSVLEDCDLISSQPDAFKPSRRLFHINEPLITFYESVMRPAWSRLELGQAEAVWQESATKFHSQVLGPHFEKLCRTFTASSDRFGTVPATVTAGTLTDQSTRSAIEVDVVALSAAEPNRPRQVLCLGEAKWGKTMDRHHLARLTRVRDLLAAKKYDVSQTHLTCFSASGFTSELVETAKRDPFISLLDIADLYQG